MRKLYSILLVALMLTGISGVAAAANYTLDIQWNNAGSITLQKKADGGSYAPVALAADATSYHFEKQADSQWDIDTYFRAYVASGYRITNCYAKAADGSTTTITSWYPEYRQIAMDSYFGQTIYIETEALQPDASFVLAVNNTPTAFTAELNGTGTINRTWQTGNNTVEYLSTVDNKLTIIPNAKAFQIENGETVYKKFFKIEVNGQDKTSDLGWNANSPMYSIDLAGVNKIEIWPLETAETKAEYTTSIAVDKPAGLASIFDRTNGRFIYNGNGNIPESITSEEGTILQFNIAEDWTVDGITFNGAPCGTATDGIYRHTVTKNGALAFAVSPTEYGTYSMTAYISNPEGARIRYGAAGAAQYIELGEGEAVSEDIVLPKVTSAAGTVPSHTMKASETKRYNLTLSKKYTNIVVETKNGYWRRDLRAGSVSGIPGSESAASVTDGTIWFNCQKVENTAKAVAYVDGETTSLRLRASRANGADRAFSLNPGYNEFVFDPEYIPAWDVAEGEANDALSVYLNGAVQARDEEKGYADIPVKDGGVLKIFPSGAPAKYAVKVTAKGQGTITYDKIKAAAAGTAEHFARTVFDITPLAGEKLYIDGAKAELDENGTYSFAVSKSHSIYLDSSSDPLGKLTITPDPAQTQETISTITIALPNATTAVLAGSADEIYFSTADKNWAPTHTSLEEVAGAQCPTYTFSFSPAATQMKAYRLMIPEGLFTINGFAVSEELEATYTVEKTATEVSYNFEPSTDKMLCEGYAYGGVVFDEDFNITAFDATKFHLAVDGQPTTDYSVSRMGNMLIWDGENGLGSTPCTITMTLDEGCVTLTGGVTSPAMSKSWQYVESKEYTYTITPDAEGATLKDVDAIYITFDNAETAEVFIPTGIVLAEDGYEADRYFETATIEAVEDAAAPTFKLTFAQMPDKAAIYNLTVTRGTFTLDGVQPNDAIAKVYDMTSGISSIILGTDKDASIYTLQGIRVSNDWNKLPAGIYIINGRKAIKK